jgi:hypothetical protein
MIKHIWSQIDASVEAKRLQFRSAPLHCAFESRLNSLSFFCLHPSSLIPLPFSQHLAWEPAPARAASLNDTNVTKAPQRSHDAALSLIFQPVRCIDSSFNPANPLLQCIFDRLELISQDETIVMQNPTMIMAAIRVSIRFFDSTDEWRPIHARRFLTEREYRDIFTTNMPQNSPSITRSELLTKIQPVKRQFRLHRPRCRKWRAFPAPTAHPWLSYQTNCVATSVYVLLYTIIAKLQEENPRGKTQSRLASQRVYAWTYMAMACENVSDITISKNISPAPRFLCDNYAANRKFT